MITTTAAYNTANAVRAQAPIFKMVIDGYTRVFTSYATGVSGQYPWLENVDPQGITISDVEGGANLGQLTFTAFDAAGSITADMATFTFEGKKIQFYQGYVGLAQADWILIFTGQIDTVDSADSDNAYLFTCSDNKKRLTNIIYLNGDSGFPTDDANRLTVTGHPIDIFIDIAITELGYAPSDVNLSKLYGYRDGIYSGWNFDFSIDSPPAAKDFIEKQLMQPMGAYLWVNNKGQLDINFFFKDGRVGARETGMIAAFVDGSGVLVAPPTPIPISAVNGTFALKAPTGAVTLQLGTDDGFYTDNIGAWNITVNAISKSVSSANRPYSSSVNPEYAYSETGSTGPQTVAVTPGTTYTITYLSGTVQRGVGAPFVLPIGDDGPPTNNGPGRFAKTPFPTTVSVFSLNATNLTGTMPVVGQAPLINNLSFRFDKSSDGKYQSESVLTSTESALLYDLASQNVIESDGLRSGFQGFLTTTFVANELFERYGFKGLMVEGLEVNWSAVKLEPGDIVDVTLIYWPDRAAGTRGLTARLFEVMDISRDFNRRTVTLKLLDMKRVINGLGVGGSGFYLITGNGEADYTAASASDQAELMFFANDSDEYSNSDPAHGLG